MAFSGIFFFFWRFMEIVTLIPTVGMLAWFVDGYTRVNQLTPDSIMALFIVSVLALAWAMATTVAYARAKHAGLLVAFLDICLVGGFIAGVYFLRNIRNEDCTNFTAGGFFIDLGELGYVGYNRGSRWALNTNKTCAMLKASWAFGIMNCFFFAITAVSLFWVLPGGGGKMGLSWC